MRTTFKPLVFRTVLTAYLIMVFALAFFSTLVSANDECKRPIGTGFSDRLLPGQCLRNGNFDFTMQYDGNLVLYDGGRACWSSGTDGTDGVYAVFSGDWQLGSPFLTLESQFGRLRYYQGAYTYLHKTGADVSLNNKGEIWIGWTSVFRC